ncbi:hypothetical protein ACP275_05G041700 [Erythranthe tilingii]
MATLKLFYFTIFIIATLSMVNSRNLDELTPDPDLQNKCGSCPCNNPCANPPPSPPPPSLPPPPPPPAPKKPPPTTNCPPPPYGGGGGGGGGQYPPNPPYIYINGPPGNLYPVDPFYSGSGRSFDSAGLMLIGGALLLSWLIPFW